MLWIDFLLPADNDAVHWDKYVSDGPDSKPLSEHPHPKRQAQKLTTQKGSYKNMLYQGVGTNPSLTISGQEYAGNKTVGIKESKTKWQAQKRHFHKCGQKNSRQPRVGNNLVGTKTVLTKKCEQAQKRRHKKWLPTEMMTSSSLNVAPPKNICRRPPCE